jgi:hypothetical protein
MKINARKILKDIEDERGKSGRVTIYVNLELYKRFQKACGKGNASPAIEQMMKAFIESK